MVSYTVRTNGPFAIEVQFEAWSDVEQFARDWMALNKEMYPPLEVHTDGFRPYKPGMTLAPGQWTGSA